MGIVFAVKY